MYELKKERAERGSKQILFTEYNPKVGKQPLNDANLNVNYKTGVIRFGSKALQTYSMEGRFIKFYIASRKNTIGWKLESRKDLSEIKSGKWKLVRTNKARTSASFSIRGILQQFNLFQKKEGAKNCEINKYVDLSMLAENNNVYYYAKLD